MKSLKIIVIAVSIAFMFVIGISQSQAEFEIEEMYPSIGDYIRIHGLFLSLRLCENFRTVYRS